MTLLFRSFSCLPLWLLHGVGCWLGWIAFLASSTYRSRFLVKANQANVPHWDIWQAVGAAGKMACELPRLWLGRPVATRWDGAQCIEEALALNKGIVFLTPHVGCFEITAQAYAARFAPLGRDITVLFRPPRQAWLRKVVESARGRPGLQTAPTTLAGVKQLIRALKRGECVGLLPDQVPPAEQGIWAPFFGKPAYTMTLSARLVSQTGATVLVAWGERLSWGRGYVVHVSPLGAELAQDVDVATAQINQAMEALIAPAASQYLWGYARYKAPKVSAHV
jgi:KDO2-lipid IV(A) lauroyltransferase